MSDNTFVMDPKRSRNVNEDPIPIATDDIASGVAAGAKVQRIKTGFGVDGSYEDVTDTNGLPVDLKGGFVSTDNSSTATLAGDAVFTGTGEDISAYSSISITSISDVVSAKSGLSMEFSSDGTNWDRKLAGHITAESSYVHALRVINKFFRIVYTNGAGAQASFRLQVVYHATNAMPLISRVGQPHATVDSIPVRQNTDVNLDFARQHIPGGR